MSDVAIKIEGVSKKYTVGKQKDGSLRGALGSALKSAASKGEDFWALKNVSFEVRKGEVIGIIGKNGAGKSTLLKILSQITKPTEGRIEITGRVASLLEVGTGFHPELTGRENIFLNGTILGMTRKEVKAKFDEIVEFSGVEKFIDTPVKHYSSGMYVRLAFAVAAHLEPEILIIDEVLAVGDAEFQKKCLGKMQDVAEHGRTVLFVSHNMNAVSELCTRGVLLEKGNVVLTASVDEVVNKYISSITANSTYINADKETDKLALVRKSEIVGADGKAHSSFRFSEEIIINLEVEVLEEINFMSVGVAVKDKWNQKIFTTVSSKQKYEQGHYSRQLILPKENLLSGSYTLDIALFTPNQKSYEYLKEIIGFEVVDTESELSIYNDPNIGALFVKCKWS